MLSLVHTRCGGVAAQVYTALRQCSCRLSGAARRITAPGTMVLDRRSLSYAALGLGPSWVLLDGIFAEVALFDRTQPEGLALATYLTAVSAVAFDRRAGPRRRPAASAVVAAHLGRRRRLRAARHRTCIGGLLARARRRRVGRAVSVRLRDFARGQLPAARPEPWAAETERATRIVELPAAATRGRSSRPSCSRSCSASTACGGSSARRRSSLPRGAIAPAGCKFSRHRARGQGRAGRDRVAQELRALSSAWRELRRAQCARTLLAAWRRVRRAQCARRDNAPDVGSFGGPAAPEEITLDDDDEERDLGRDARLSLKMPPLSRRSARRGPGSAQECRRLAYSEHITSWPPGCLLRSFLPYAASLTAPEASKDGAAYLAVAVSGSLITCFVGALFAMRRDAPINVAKSDAVVTAGCLAVALASLVCGVAGRPKNPVAALVVVFATWIVRFLDGYCSPLFYRRIHALSESIDVLQWAGVVAIWVVNAGVWLSLAVVLGVEAWLLLGMYGHSRVFFGLRSPASVVTASSRVDVDCARRRRRRRRRSPRAAGPVEAAARREVEEGLARDEVRFLLLSRLLTLLLLDGAVEVRPEVVPVGRDLLVGALLLRARRLGRRLRRAAPPLLRHLARAADEVGLVVFFGAGAGSRATLRQSGHDTGATAASAPPWARGPPARRCIPSGRYGRTGGPGRRRRSPRGRWRTRAAATAARAPALPRRERRAVPAARRSRGGGGAAAGLARPAPRVRPARARRRRCSRRRPARARPWRGGGGLHAVEVALLGVVEGELELRVEVRADLVEAALRRGLPVRGPGVVGGAAGAGGSAGSGGSTGSGGAGDRGGAGGAGATGSAGAGGSAGEGRRGAAARPWPRRAAAPRSRRDRSRRGRQRPPARRRAATTASPAARAAHAAARRQRWRWRCGSACQG